MDLTALQTRCKTRFRDTAGSIVDDAGWTGFLNDAYQQVNGALPWWPWKESRSGTLTYAPGDRSKPLPADVSRVNAVWSSTDKIPLVPLENRHSYRSLYPDGTETGVPGQYRVFAGTLEVYPLPTAQTVIVIDYFAAPAPLAGATDEPAFPEQFHRILVEGALARAYEDDGATEQAKTHWGHYTEILAGLVLDLGAADQSERYPEIVDEWYA